jgi:hypothetical protein
VIQLPPGRRDVIYEVEERFQDLAEYERVKEPISQKEFSKVEQKITIMHPLPRVDESTGCGQLSGSAYFRQMRMVCTSGYSDRHGDGEEIDRSADIKGTKRLLWDDTGAK